MERGSFLSPCKWSCRPLGPRRLLWPVSPGLPLLGAQRYHYKRRWGQRMERRLVPKHWAMEVVTSQCPSRLTTLWGKLWVQSRHPQSSPCAHPEATGAMSTDW